MPIHLVPPRSEEPPPQPKRFWDSVGQVVIDGLLQGTLLPPVKEKPQIDLSPFSPADAEAQRMLGQAQAFLESDFTDPGPFYPPEALRALKVLATSPEAEAAKKETADFLRKFRLIAQSRIDGQRINRPVTFHEAGQLEDELRLMPVAKAVPLFTHFQTFLETSYAEKDERNNSFYRGLIHELRQGAEKRATLEEAKGEIERPQPSGADRNVSPDRDQEKL